MLSPQQKTTTLVKILFGAAHTYSKDSKKRCLVIWSKNQAALVHTRAARFLTNLPDTFFGILGVCMSCPEEDFDQGGRFLLRREHFRIFFK